MKTVQPVIFDDEVMTAFGGGGGGGGGRSSSSSRVTANSVCNAGIAATNLGGAVTLKTRSPHVAGATAVVAAGTTVACAYAFGAGQRNSLW